MLLKVYQENTRSCRLGLRDVGIVEKDSKEGLSMAQNNYHIVTPLPRPANWRNISHVLRRSSIDCRRQHIRVTLNRDLDRSADIWSESEMVYLRQLVDACGHHWVELGRDLGRTSVQCYNSFHNFYQEIDDDSVYAKNGEIDNADISGEEGRCNDAGPNYMKKVGYSVDVGTPVIGVRKLVNRFRFWDDKEDALLMDLAKQHGNSWRIIGKEMGRTNRECFQRYQVRQQVIICLS